MSARPGRTPKRLPRATGPLRASRAVPVLALPQSFKFWPKEADTALLSPKCLREETLKSMPYLELKQAREVRIDPKPDERGQLLAYAEINGGRRIALTLNTN